MASFHENKLLNRIVTHLNENGFKAHNKFGEETNLDKALQQIGHVYCFFEAEDYVPQTSQTQYGKIFLQFWTIDQAFGIAAIKDDFVADKLRDYINSDSWKNFDISTDYPTMDFEVFMLESGRNFIHADTNNKITIFRGSIKFKAKLSS